MASRCSAQASRGLMARRVGAWDLVVKVKYGDNLKRLHVCVDCVTGPFFYHDLAALRSKIASAFKFSPDTEFILTYSDEDGDVVLLDDDHDLHDAVIKQKLKPLRINVQLKSSKDVAIRTEQQASNSRSLRFTDLEDQFAQVKSAIDEALKLVPEQVPAVLAKLSHDLRSRVASAPSLAELLDRFAKLMTPRSNVQPSNVHGTSRSYSGWPQASANSEIKHDSAVQKHLAMEPSDIQNSETSKVLGLKRVLSEDSPAKIEQALYPLFGDLLTSTSAGGMKYGIKESADSEIKRKSDAFSKGKFVISSLPSVTTTSHGASTQQSAPAPCMGENALKYLPTPTYKTYGSNGNINMPLPFPSPPVVYPPPVMPPYNLDFVANGKTNRDSPSVSFPPRSIFSPFNLSMPSPVGSHTDLMASSRGNFNVPNPGGINSFGSSYTDPTAQYGIMTEGPLHRWIQCDVCNVAPIVGSSYKSNVKEDYYLCSFCFSRMGNEAEYTRLDRPVPQSKARFIREPLKPDCFFIKDVTIPDGTVLLPSTPFTKIWRMYNCGSASWPFGTHFTWVGGHEFACQYSVALKNSASSEGHNPGQAIDVAVGFLSPAKPGTYISYWRMALPSGQTFGEQVWIQIQVKLPVPVPIIGSIHGAATMNLNLPPESISSKPKPSTTNMNDPAYSFSEYPGSACNRRAALIPGPIMRPMGSKPAPCNMASAPSAVEPAENLNSGAPASSALAPVPSGVPAPEATPLPDRAAPAPAARVGLVSAYAAYSADRTFAAPLSFETMKRLEQTMMARELQHIGLREKEMFRRQECGLEQPAVDHSGVDNEWDPTLGAELSSLGIDDAEMNEEEEEEAAAVVESDDDDTEMNEEEVVVVESDDDDGAEMNEEVVVVESDEEEGFIKILASDLWTDAKNQ